MTDMYGTEPHQEPGHDEVLTHEHDVVQEPPSDYEFSDDHGAAASEEQADDPGILSSDGESPRRSPFLPIAAAIGGIILLGGVAYWQFGGSSSPPPMLPSANAGMAPVISTKPPETVAAAPSNNVPVSTVAPKTNAASMGTLPGDSAPVPVLSAQVPALAPVPVAAAPEPAPSAFPAAGVPSSAPVAAASAGDQHLAAINARMDELQKSIEQTNQQISQVAAMVETSAGNVNNAVAANKGTEERLDKIEQQLAQLRHPAPVLAAPSSLPAQSPVTPAPIAAKPPSAPAHKAPVSAVHHEAHKHRETVKERPPIWILRAASPGQAWVSLDPTSHDLTQLHVGDTLKGIGRVTAIQQQDGNWVVQGTKGSIP